MSRITVYSTDPCSFCTRVKGLLDARGVEYTEVNLAKDPAGRVELARRTRMMSFPQVLIEGELLGGFAELQAAAEDGRLDALLGRAQSAVTSEDPVGDLVGRGLVTPPDRARAPRKASVEVRGSVSDIVTEQRR